MEVQVLSEETVQVDLEGVGVVEVTEVQEVAEEVDILEVVVERISEMEKVVVEEDHILQEPGHPFQLQTQMLWVT